MKSLTCDNCCLVWLMTEYPERNVFCPYCGKKQVPPTKDYINTKKEIEDEIVLWECMSERFSCTNDYSYWWGYIDSLRQTSKITAREYKKLLELKNKFRGYQNKGGGSE